MGISNLTACQADPPSFAFDWYIDHFCCCDEPCWGIVFAGAVGFEPLAVAEGEDTTRTCEVGGGLDAEGVHRRVREFLATL